MALLAVALLLGAAFVASLWSELSSVLSQLPWLAILDFVPAASVPSGPLGRLGE